MNAVLAFGLDLASKATVVLGMVLLVQYVLGRRRASLGSAVGNAGVVGLLLMPFSAMVLPALTVTYVPWSEELVSGGADVPPANLSALQVAHDDSLAQAGGTPSPPPTYQAAGREISKGDPPVDSRAEAEAETSPVRGAAEPVPFPPAPVSFAEAAPAATPTRTPSIDWAAAVVVGHAAVALVLLVRLGFSVLAVARLRRSCERVADEAWTSSLERWRRRLGIGREVALAWSPCVGVPVVLGWFSPAIVLPGSLTGPDSGRHADAVLLHELAHVRRGDYAWNLLLRLVQALYWPHVLVWVLGRAIAEGRERACDALCVHEMGGPSAYRETLLAVAAGMVRGPSPVLGLAMARPSRLGRRLAQIERGRGDGRCLPRWPTRLAIGALAVIAAGVIGAVQLVRSEARASALDEPPKPPQAVAPASDPIIGKTGRVFQLRVVAADTGEPVPNADVRVWIAMNDDWRKTDAEGRLDITHSTGPADRRLTVDVWGVGRAMQRHWWGDDLHKPIPDGATVKLLPGERLGGLVQDEEGRPIAGATVYLWSHNYKKRDPHELLFDLRAVSGPDGKWQTSGAPETTGELLGFYIVHPDFLSGRDYSQKESIPKIADLRAGKAVTVMKKGVPIEGRVVDAGGKPVAGARVLSSNRQDVLFTDVKEFAVVTDADGRFRTGQVKAGEWFLVAAARGHGPGEQRLKIGTAVPQVEIKLGRPRPLRGRVVDPDGKPIAGAFVNTDNWRGHRCLGGFFWTDADGRFRWDDAPDDELLVNVDGSGYRGVFMQRVSPSEGEAVFTLQPSLLIQGEVRDSETQKRVENATVEYSALDPGTGEPTAWKSMPELGASTGVLQGHLSLNLPVTADRYKIRVRSPGYETFISRTFRREEKVVIGYDVTLVPGRAAGRKGTVLRPDGKPLAGARVYSTRINEGLSVNDGVVQGRGISEKGRTDITGPDGTFPIPEYDKPWVVLIVGDDAYAIAGKAALEKSPEVHARAYGQIEGRYLVGKRPLADQEIALSGFLQNRSTMSCTISFNQKTTTDRDGRFTFKKVIPIAGLRVSRRDRNDRIRTLGDPVRVEPGQTVKVTAGGRGRPVVGRVDPPRDWTQPIDFTDRSHAAIESNRPWTPEPLSLYRGKTPASLGGAWLAWFEDWQDSAEGRDYRDRRVAAAVSLASDGSFRIDDVPPGEYRLAIRVNEDNSTREPGPFARIVRVFTVPPVPGGQSDEPLDLGPMRLGPRVVLKAGDPAPPFEVTTVDGKKLAVPGDFRGKVLLLDFGTMWDGQSGFQITRLNEVHQKFGKDSRFVILSLVSAADNAESRKFVEEKGEAWPQAVIGPLSNPIASAYGVNDENVPSTILIGPDGKIAAKDLWYDKIGEAVGQALGKAGK